VRARVREVVSLRPRAQELCNLVLAAGTAKYVDKLLGRPLSDVTTGLLGAAASVIGIVTLA
jgi:hypothetical protein